MRKRQNKDTKMKYKKGDIISIKLGLGRTRLEVEEREVGRGTGSLHSTGSSLHSTAHSALVAAAQSCDSNCWGNLVNERSRMRMLGI
jgi:hypothetical protein